MAKTLTGTVRRCLPDQRIVVKPSGNGGLITADASGAGSPRPGAEVTLVQAGDGWMVVSWR